MLFLCNFLHGGTILWDVENKLFQLCIKYIKYIIILNIFFQAFPQWFWLTYPEKTNFFQVLISLGVLCWVSFLAYMHSVISRLISETYLIETQIRAYLWNYLKCFWFLEILDTKKIFLMFDLGKHSILRTTIYSSLRFLGLVLNC